jgi:hypothetical protein
MAVAGNGDGLPQQRKAVNPFSPTPTGGPHVFISLRGTTDKTGAGGCRQVYELSAVSQVSNVLRNHGALLILGLVVAFVIGGVVLPAVWSGKKARRTAALDVLDRILRWRRLFS